MEIVAIDGTPLVQAETFARQLPRSTELRMKVKPVGIDSHTKLNHAGMLPHAPY